MVVLIAIAAGNTKPATTTTRPAAPVMGQHEIDMLSWRLVVGEAVTGAHGISDETIDNMADAFCQIADGSNGNGFIFGATILAVGEDYGFGPTEVGAMAGASLEMRCPWHSDILAEYR